MTVVSQPPALRTRLLLPTVQLQVLAGCGALPVAAAVFAPRADAAHPPDGAVRLLAGELPVLAAALVVVAFLATAVGTVNRVPWRWDAGGLHWSWYAGIALAAATGPLAVAAAAHAALGPLAPLGVATGIAQLALLTAPAGRADAHIRR